jgi:hypothetical protein
MNSPIKWFWRILRAVEIGFPLICNGLRAVCLSMIPREPIGLDVATQHPSVRRQNPDRAMVRRFVGAGFALRGMFLVEAAGSVGFVTPGTA